MPYVVAKTTEENKVQSAAGQSNPGSTKVHPLPPWGKGNTRTLDSSLPCGPNQSCRCDRCLCLCCPRGAEYPERRGVSGSRNNSFRKDALGPPLALLSTNSVSELPSCHCLLRNTQECPGSVHDLSCPSQRKGWILTTLPVHVPVHFQMKLQKQEETPVSPILQQDPWPLFSCPAPRLRSWLFSQI